MPMNPRDYPPTWRELSRRLRFERAGGKCEQCGAEHGQPHPVSGKRVVLTCAHLDHDPSSADESRIAVLCAPCHLRYDQALHAAHARVTRARKRAGQLPLPLIGVPDR